VEELHAVCYVRGNLDAEGPLEKFRLVMQKFIQIPKRQKFRHYTQRLQTQSLQLHQVIVSECAINRVSVGW
jgi:hypothetical protein